MNRSPRWREEALTRRHDRATFDCGVTALNDYLRRYARQNHESGGAKTFVAVAVDSPSAVLGYYTISAVIAWSSTARIPACFATSLRCLPSRPPPALDC